MKRKVISLLVVLFVMGAAWTAMADREGQTRRRAAAGDSGGVSAEQRTQMRERFENMSEEERAKFREDMRQRWQGMSEQERAAAQARGGFGGRGMNREAQLASIKAIQEQLTKLKAAVEAGPTGGARTNYRDMSEEDRTKLREQMSKQREARVKIIAAIETEVGKLKGPSRESSAIAQVAELTRIQALAKEERAPKTARALQGLIMRAQRPSPATPSRRGAPEGRRVPSEGRRGAREGADADAGAER